MAAVVMIVMGLMRNRSTNTVAVTTELNFRFIGKVATIVFHHSAPSASCGTMPGCEGERTT